MLTPDIAPALPLPLRAEAITPQWLSAALSIRHPGTRVTACRVVDAILGTSTKLRVAVDYAGPTDLPEQFIVKGGFEDHSHTMEWMFHTEMRFYRDIAPLVPLNVPQVYFTGSDPDTYQAIVIMEDLNRRAVRFCHALRPQSHEEISRRLRAMAALHAATWNSPRFAPGGGWDWVGTRFSASSGAYLARFLVPEVWEGFVALPRGAAVSRTLLDRERMATALDRLGAISAAGDSCLLHGDTHLGNLYVDADGTPGFLDMQVSRGHWALEVAYHIGGGIDMVDRRLWERDLLATYLAALGEHGVAAPDFASAWQDYVRFLAYGFFIFLINDVHFQTESVNTANTARLAAAMLDHGTMDLLG